MLGIQAGLGVGQALLGQQGARRQEERMREQAASDKLIQSFNPGAQPTPVAPQQPGVTQQMLSDPITKQLLAGLVGKGIGALTNRPPTVGLGGGGGVQNVASPINYMTP
jgi:hypothetical protein